MAETFAVEMWPVDRPKPYPGNPRRNAGAVDKVARSLEAFGWQQPIVVDRKGVVVVGDTRLKAAKRLGWKQVPVHVARKLTPAQATAYRLADNRTGEEAEWDDALLVAELRALEAGEPDLLTTTGFDADELADLFGAEPVDPAEADQQPVPAPPAKPRTKPGDRIVLGSHVLVCGDATKPATWAKLLGDERPVAIWTDPPYGVGYGEKNAYLNRAAGKGNSDTWGRIETPIEGDGLEAGADLPAILRAALGLARDHVAPGGAWFVCAPPGPAFHTFGTVLADLGVWRQTLAWIKNSFVIGRSDFHYRHEVILAGYSPPPADDLDPDGVEQREFVPIAYGWTPGDAHEWLGDRKQDTVLEVDRPASSRLHPTMKPVALIDPLLRLTVPDGGLVVDPFAGSGSTLIACETSGRVARCLELSPAYCDVIVTRWEEMTGGKAKRK